MKRAILSILAIVLSFSLYFSLVNVGENQARIQNNFNLESVITCTVDEIGKGEKTTPKLTIALNTCAKNQRSMGITGDVFVIRKSDRKLFWDSSQDCKPENELKLFMTEDGVCSLFKKPETCLVAVNTMIEKPPEGSLVWQFDDSIEYVDYRYLPIKVENEEYIIGQGTQKDEVQSAFILTYIILLIGTVIIILALNF